eukprot:TRINITY_DN3938_c0_g1_i7.p1 TRINITY_DN3938_c0_g1~~TRINITY_DN3938_c0_g1_i7.p1  ORF type:complete len:294 (-),score=49.70 TRINITY_DN3938_c0_g1_i7:66-947(-)
MSNIRSLRDYERVPSNALPPAQPFPRYEGSNNADVGQVGLLPPRNAFPTIGEILCPRFHWKSFTMFISVVQLIMFIVSLIVGATKYDGAFVKSNEMGGPSALPLLDLGAKYLPYIRKGEVYRFITPIFLHAGILHIASNLFFQCRMGFSLEEQWEMKPFIGVYFIAGIGGTLLSCVAAPSTVSVGASGALFGILGGELAYLMMNWSALTPFVRNQELCMLISILLINFLISMLTPLIDNWAHLGGLIFGFLAGGLILKSLGVNSNEKTIRYVCGAILFVLTLAFVLAIFLAKL